MEFFQFDDAYLRGLLRGDSRIEEHFASYFGELIRIKLGRRISSPDAIEDIRQETLRRVFRIIQSEPGVRHAEALGGLVSSVCNKVFLEVIRKRQRERGIVEDTERASPLRDPLESLIADERAQAVRDLLDQLPARDRHLLTAVFLDDTDRDALCVELGVSRDYLRVVLHRAAERFRKCSRVKEESFPEARGRMGSGGT